VDKSLFTSDNKLIRNNTKKTKIFSFVNRHLLVNVKELLPLNLYFILSILEVLEKTRDYFMKNNKLTPTWEMYIQIINCTVA